MKKIMTIWKEADAVCFDVDSTVIQEEGIDELAKFCGKGPEVEEITKHAMEGRVEFREALSERMNIIRPTMTHIRHFIRVSSFRLTPGVKTLINCLHQRSISVFLISCGFKCFISPLALQLKIPLENIYANKLKFYLDGEYAGFDENEPTSRSGGKGEVICKLRKEHGYNKIVMIGDGVTDLEACPPADAFIGYGGNVVRKKVKNKSQWYVTDFQELTDAL